MGKALGWDAEYLGSSLLLTTYIGALLDFSGPECSPVKWDFGWASEDFC